MEGKKEKEATCKETEDVIATQVIEKTVCLYLLLSDNSYNS